jgi:thioredoxin 1
MATAVTEATFEQEVLKHETPVLVDFWAEWCGPCHAVSPILDRIAAERELKLVKINVDEEQALSIRFGIQSIPAMVLFKDGEPASATVGARPKGQIEQQLRLDELVGPKVAA